MKEFEIISGKVYRLVDSKILQEDINKVEAHLKEKVSLLADVEEVEAIIEAERLEAERLEAERLEAKRLEAEKVEAERIAILGECVPIEEGQTRILEFDAQVLPDSGFEERYFAYTNYRRRKVKIYDLEAGYGNGIFTDYFKPAYDPQSRSLVFSLDSPKGGMPSFINAFKTSPLWGGGQDGWDSLGSHGIVHSTRFRFAFDIEFSANWWEYFKTIRDKTTARWLNLVQMKQSYSYIAGRVISLGWSWPKDEPHFRILQSAHSKDDDIGRGHSNGREGYHLKEDAPIRPGERQHVEFELKFSNKNDGSAYTRVEIDGVEYLNHTDVNCYPLTTLDRDRFPDREVHERGIYFGGYWGTRPYLSFPGAGTYVRYSNVSVDVGEPTNIDEDI